jgi:hypothetical protein
MLVSFNDSFSYLLVTSEISALCVVQDLLIAGSYGFDTFSISTGELILTKSGMSSLFALNLSRNNWLLLNSLKWTNYFYWS